ncbi:MAG: rod shape-determining protein MreD [Alphaproteobacteria bacterium]|nr:rod shape-determining protein MreD [Alphaproteobacteria bacterium]
MQENWKEIVSGWIVKSLPLLFSLLWMILSLIPLRSDLNLVARPMIGLMCVYFWTMYRSDLFGVFSVFVLGMFFDILSIAPFGIYTLLYLIMYVTVINVSKYITEKNFEILWVGFSLLLAGLMFVGWFMSSLYYTQFLPFKSFLFSYFISVALYPLVAGVNAWVMNVFLQDDDI